MERRDPRHWQSVPPDGRHQCERQDDLDIQVEGCTRGGGRDDSVVNVHLQWGPFDGPVPGRAQ
ncbi:hypothetical protein D3C85_985510 [compost metagenome]